MLLLLPTDIRSSSSDTLMDKKKKVKLVHSKQEFKDKSANQYVQWAPK